MKITQEIIDALEKAISDAGSIYKLARDLGIAHSTIYFWKTGKTTKINSQLWNSCVRKKLRPYLTVASDGESSSSVGESSAAYGNKPKSFPMIGFDNLAGFDPHVTAVPDFIRAQTISHEFFSSAGGITCFSVRMNENSECIVFPAGTTLLVESGRPPVSGEIVIVKLKNKKNPSFCIFRHEKNEYCLKPYFSGKDKSQVWPEDTSSSKFIDWMFPVLEAHLKFQPEKSL